LNIILTGQPESLESTARGLRKFGCSVSIIRTEALVERLRGNLDVFSVADAIVYARRSDNYFVHGEEFVLADTAGLSVTAITNEGERLARDIAALPDYAQMRDGRTWKNTPLVVTLPVVPYAFSGKNLLASAVPPRSTSGNVWYAPLSPAKVLYSRISQAVAEYRKRLLDEYDNLGFVVRLINGRYRVGPALKPREELSGKLYYGPGDKRDANRYFTVDRELYGIQRDIEEFEELLNRPNVREADLHRFFEEHPEFLAILGEQNEPISHPFLTTRDGTPIIPDFLLKPVVAPSRDSRWLVLDIKKPNPKVIVNRGRDSRLSAHVMDAVRQLRRYRDYFRDPGHQEAIMGVVGQPLRYPKLGVLIGRMPEGEDVRVLENEEREYDVRIVTYDEVLEMQREIYRAESLTRG